MASVCSLGGGPPAVLAGALADRLLVMRGDQVSDAGVKVSARQVALLPSLLLGWASLAACSILPGKVPADLFVDMPGKHFCASVCVGVCHAGSQPLRLNGQQPGKDWVLLHGAGGWWRARQEMTTLIASYDSSTVEETLLSALVSAGAVTAAHALAKHQVLFFEARQFQHINFHAGSALNTRNSFLG